MVVKDKICVPIIKYLCICLCLDFMSLELREGYPVLLVDFGTGTVKIEQRHIKVSDGEKHRIDIIWTKTVSVKIY